VAFGLGRVVVGVTEVAERFRVVAVGNQQEIAGVAQCLIAQKSLARLLSCLYHNALHVPSEICAAKTGESGSAKNPSAVLLSGTRQRLVMGDYSFVVLGAGFSRASHFCPPP